MMNGDAKGGTCACPHHKMIPLFVVAFGLLFLLKELGMVGDQVVNLGWPALVIAGGLMKLTKGMCKCC
ncbi:MAG: hypothetical protein HY482_02830 [Candidatus Wildermuthbacteria bacterium]|nr:hypothetical protein [Candidatus Wildermuthbacteria bacterium]